MTNLFRASRISVSNQQRFGSVFLRMAFEYDSAGKMFYTDVDRLSFEHDSAGKMHCVWRMRCEKERVWIEPKRMPKKPCKKRKVDAEEDADVDTAEKDTAK